MSFSNKVLISLLFSSVTFTKTTPSSGCPYRTTAPRGASKITGRVARSSSPFTKILIGFSEAVSYTHLDVYKRQICGTSDLAEGWSGLLIILDAERSEIAKKLGVDIPDRFALKVR